MATPTEATHGSQSRETSADQRQRAASTLATSILFDRLDGYATLASNPPACFHDLNLDQLIAAITAQHQDYDLTPFFSTPLHDPASVRYRQDVLRDLERHAIGACVTTFAAQMRAMRQRLAQARKLHNPYQRQWWFLHAVALYRDAITALATDLTTALAQIEGGAENENQRDTPSRGLRQFADYLTAYHASAPFTTLSSETSARLRDLAGVRYCVHIQGSRVTVSPYAEDADYSAEVLRTFARFQQGAVKDYRAKLSSWPELDTVEARTLDLVARRLYPDIFQALADYYDRHQDYLDAAIAQFDREAQFYLAYLAYIKPLRAAGLPFCIPEVAIAACDLHARDLFDLALASKLATGASPASPASPIVLNDIALNDPERIIVVTGPNQGGKTTFARAFGQLCYLASLGLLVPGRDARLPLPDRNFTHFEREEDPAALQGKLEDELVRIHAILEHATSASVIIMNESFSSTTLQDALLVGERVLRRIIAQGALCVYVTFMDELASLDEHVVSMMSAVVPHETTLRTFKITRQPANGLAYAAALAESYGLTYEALRRQVTSASELASASTNDASERDEQRDEQRDEREATTL